MSAPAPLAQLGQAAVPGEQQHPCPGHELTRARDDGGGRRLARGDDIGAQRAAARRAAGTRKEVEQAAERLVVGAPRAHRELDGAGERDDVADAGLVVEHVVGVGDDAA